MFNLEYIRFAERITALHAPIYYYVKRKGSLVTTQGTSLTKTIQMKLGVFEYYHNFYKHVWDEEEYEKNRLQLYRFLVDAASDGLVGIPLLPGTKKLGDERAGVSASALAGEGMLSELYRERKLMQRYLEVAALKNDLTPSEAYLLLCLSHLSDTVNKKELADFAGVSRSALAMQLQKLVLRGLIKVEDISNPKPMRQKKAKGIEKDDASRKPQEKRARIMFQPEAEPILRELATVQRDYDEARFAGFEEEDLIQYARHDPAGRPVRSPGGRLRLCPGHGGPVHGQLDRQPAVGPGLGPARGQPESGAGRPFPCLPAAGLRPGLRLRLCRRHLAAPHPRQRTQPGRALALLSAAGAGHGHGHDGP